MIFQQFTHAGMAAALVACRVLIFVYASFSEATLLRAHVLPKEGYPYVSEDSIFHARSSSSDRRRANKTAQDRHQSQG